MYQPQESGGGSIGNALGQAAGHMNSGGGSKKKKRRPSGGGSSGSSGSSGSGRHNSGGGSGGGRNNGGGGGGGGAPSKPKAPGIKGYLAGDSAYQSGVSGQNRALKDYFAEINRRRGEATTQYGQTKASMERDRVRQLDDIRQEFASRGLIQSGLFADEQGKFQQQFTDQLNSLDAQQKALLADLLSQQTNYQREHDMTVEQLRQEALARRAAKYGI